MAGDIHTICLSTNHTTYKGRMVEITNETKMKLNLVLSGISQNWDTHTHQKEQKYCKLKRGIRFTDHTPSPHTYTHKYTMLQNLVRTSRIAMDTETS